MAIYRMCKDCGKSIIVYDTVTNRCPKCKIKRLNSKPAKPTRQVGKEGERYSFWLHSVARPYLDNKYGRNCSICKLPPPVNEETGEVGYHDVDHIKKRGSHHELKFKVVNLRYACRNCHQKETDKKGVDIMFTL